MGRSVVRLAVAALLVATPATGQSLAERSPNLSGGWVGQPGQLYFNFVHRFDVLGDIDKVVNSPTFLLAAGLPANLLLGAQYASNARIVQTDFNEFEIFGRFRPLSQMDGAPVDLGLQAAFNESTTSLDGEVTVGRAFGVLKLIGVGRVLGDAFDSGESKLAVGGGGTLRLGGSPFYLAGDAVKLLDAGELGDDVAWSAGLHITIPRTPHSLSIQASNVRTTTLHGSSRGTADETLWGFEFTVPLTLSRWFGGGDHAAAEGGHNEPTPSAAAEGEMTTIDIVDFRFTNDRVEVPVGTTIEWTNRGQVVHTVTSDDGVFNSGNVQPGETWRYTFDEAGEFPYHCIPHPFMTGTVVVTGP